MALSHSPSIVTDGLVLCLDAANLKSYPGTGTTWFDISGNNNHFTISGTPIFSSINGFSGFSSTNKITRSSFPSNLFTSQGGNGFTIICWARSTGIPSPAEYQKIAGNGDSENYIDYYINPTGYFRIEAGANGFYNGNISTPGVDTTLYSADGNWRMYGASLLDRTVSNPTVPFGIGNEGNASFNYPFNGSIAIVHLYNRVLSGSEITQNFNALRGRFNL